MTRGRNNPWVAGNAEKSRDGPGESIVLMSDIPRGYPAVGKVDHYDHYGHYGSQIKW